MLGSVRDLDQSIRQVKLHLCAKWLTLPSIAWPARPRKLRSSAWKKEKDPVNLGFFELISTTYFEIRSASVSWNLEFHKRCKQKPTELPELSLQSLFLFARWDRWETIFAES